jgi:hypothetical protein
MGAGIIINISIVLFQFSYYKIYDIPQIKFMFSNFACDKSS